MTIAPITILLLSFHEPAWQDVIALAAGTLKLVMRAGDVDGAFVAANADTLVVHSKKDNLSVDRASIKRLDRRLSDSNRGRNIGRGVGAGLVAGLLGSKFACDGCSVLGAD